MTLAVRLKKNVITYNYQLTKGSVLLYFSACSFHIHLSVSFSRSSRSHTHTHLCPFKRIICNAVSVSINKLSLLLFYLEPWKNLSAESRPPKVMSMSTSEQKSGFQWDRANIKHILYLDFFILET